MIKEYITRKRAKVARQYVDDVNGRTLLDIGCGDRWFTHQFKNIEVIGIDKKYGDEIKKKINFENGFFDYVTMLAVLEHLPFPKDIIDECARILKKGGILIITMPFENIILNIIHALFYKKDVEKSPHIQNISKDDMDKLTEPYFKLKKYKTFEFGLNRLFVYEKK